MAVGTSDGEYFPSHLESVLASLDTSGSTKEPLAPRNALIDELRNGNEDPASRPAPTDVRSDVKVAQAGAGNKDDSSPADMQGPPTLGRQDSHKNLQDVEEHVRKGLEWDTGIWTSKDPALHEGTPEDRFNTLDEGLRESQDAIDKRFEEAKKAWGGNLINQAPDPAGRIRMRKDIPAVKDYLDNLPDDVDAIDMKDGSVVFQLKRNLTSDADLPINAKPTAAEFTPDSTWAAMVDSFTNPDSKVPSAEKMVQGNYSKVVDWLTEHGKTPGQEMQNWSTKEKLGYMISTAMGLVGAGPHHTIDALAPPIRPPVDMKLSGKDLGVSNVEPHSFNPANSNIPGLGKAHSAMTPLELMSDSEFMQQLEKSHPEINSPYERALANQKLGRKEPTGDSADEFIQSLRRGNKPNLTLVDKNPTQEPQAGYKPSQEQIDAQRNQQREAKVNVGQGKGVLNDNIDLVGAMVAKGMKPSEIAKRFDITPLAVRSWIKRKGGINNIEDILKKRYQDEDQ